MAADLARHPAGNLTIEEARARLFPLPDLSVRQRGRAQLSARADGFAARLAGASRYANPYAEKIDATPIDSAGLRWREHGWLWGFAQAWWDGWNAADSLVS